MAYDRFVTRRQFAKLALGVPAALQGSAQTQSNHSSDPADYTLEIAPYPLELSPHS